ncbi:MAG TPA: galactokinase family protein, partial [Micromonosporaceae bacterium]|nr:galactokinase family protein [Micromonosporaceae bacterium]
MQPTASQRVRAGFVTALGREPTVVADAPGRVNLIGEHVDYLGGPVLPVPLRQRTAAALAARADDRVVLRSAQGDGVWDGTLAGLRPGSLPGWTAYAGGVLWALREDGHDLPGLELFVDGDVPLGAGLSSSAAVSCAVALGAAGLLGHDLTPALRRSLVEVCVRAETEVAGAPTGGMDQTVALLAEPGAALLIDFGDDPPATRPVPLDLGGA